MGDNHTAGNEIQSPLVHRTSLYIQYSTMASYTAIGQAHSDYKITPSHFIATVFVNAISSSFALNKVSVIKPLGFNSKILFVSGVDFCSTEKLLY